MGKSKSKKSQPKRYPTPTDKYLIVTDPWGGVPMKTSDFFNNVTAWFEIMFKPKYPGVRPSAIFYQFTNKNIIVEIPDNIDVEPYLGTHYWSSFLLPPYCYEVGARASYIYEFETRFFPTPAAQGGWTAGYAQYTKIRSDFFIREPYPPPLPAQNSSLAFARKLPPGRHAEVAQIPPLPMLLPDQVPVSDNATLPSLDPGGSSSRDLSTDNQRNNDVNESRSPSRARSERPGAQVSDPRRRDATPTRDTPHLQPYQPPSHLAEAVAHLANDTPSRSSNSMPPPPLPTSTSSKLANKMDPYEEEEAATMLLRSPTASVSPARGLSVKSEVEVKQELLPPDHDEEYMPSLALQEAFRSLETPTDDSNDLPDFSDDEEDIHPKMKVEVQDEDYQPSTEWAQAFSSLDHQSDSGSNSDAYVPSESLLSALASLPGGMVDVASPPMSSRGGVRVKSEPEDDVSFAALNGRERSMTLLSEPSSARIRIKREPSDEYGPTKRARHL